MKHIIGMALVALLGCGGGGQDGGTDASEDLKQDIQDLPVEDVTEAAEPVCPVAEFKIMLDGVEVADGGEVLVQSTLDFIDQSYDPTVGGGIVSYEWSVSKAAGSADVFHPTHTFSSPQFTANVVGEYVFQLEVFNIFGIKCCNAATKVLKVTAGQGCHIELTWSTPNDPDPTDQCFAGKDCGSDMDLHVVHPYASTPDVDKDGKPDGFFDTKYDCFFFNPHPIWVEELAVDPLFQPHLDRDDTDGAGPENFNYVEPEIGKCYKVGVHYWDDHGFGPSRPTIRVFIDNALVYEKAPGSLVEHDMWEVGEACCSDVANPFVEYTVGGAPLIVPNYINPEFYLGVPLTVGFTDYVGAYPLLDVARVYLFKQIVGGKPLCGSLNPYDLPTATVVSPKMSIIEFAYFEELPELQKNLIQNYTVVGLAQAGNGPVQAWGCEDGSTPGKTTTVEWGKSTLVKLDLVDIP